jgi:hypothetical protein
VTVPKEQVFGDAETFKRAANERTRESRQDAERRGKDLSRNKARWCVSYLHVVLSPANRAALTDEDFGRLLMPWIRDAAGRELPYFAVVHREEPGREHLHLALVRDKFEAGELRTLKDHTDALAMSLEMENELEQETLQMEEREYGLELEWTW